MAGKRCSAVRLVRVEVRKGLRDIVLRMAGLYGSHHLIHIDGVARVVGAAELLDLAFGDGPRIFNVSDGLAAIVAP